MNDDELMDQIFADLEEKQRKRELEDQKIMMRFVSGDEDENLEDIVENFEEYDIEGLRYDFLCHTYGIDDPSLKDQFVNAIKSSFPLGFTIKGLVSSYVFKLRGEEPEDMATFSENNLISLIEKERALRRSLFREYPQINLRILLQEVGNRKKIKNKDRKDLSFLGSSYYELYRGTSDREYLKLATSNLEESERQGNNHVMNYNLLSNCYNQWYKNTSNRKDLEKTIEYQEKSVKVGNRSARNYSYLATNCLELSSFFEKEGGSDYFVPLLKALDYAGKSISGGNKQREIFYLKGKCWFKLAHRIDKKDFDESLLDGVQDDSNIEEIYTILRTSFGMEGEK